MADGGRGMWKRKREYIFFTQPGRMAEGYGGCLCPEAMSRVRILSRYKYPAGNSGRVYGQEWQSWGTNHPFATDIVGCVIFYSIDEGVFSGSRWLLDRVLVDVVYRFIAIMSCP